jgi:acyl-CoA reductase-like NAD-dependent aldehyde dehydrogenase
VVSCKSYKSSLRPHLTFLSSQNAGQNCIGIERLIVHADQYDELYKMLRERIDKLRCGSVMSPSAEGYLTPVDVGSMINDDRFDGLEAWIKEAEDDGAQVHGGGKYHHVYCEHGTYFKPALVGITNGAPEITKHEGWSVSFDFNYRR